MKTPAVTGIRSGPAGFAHGYSFKAEGRRRFICSCLTKTEWVWEVQQGSRVAVEDVCFHYSYTSCLRVFTVIDYFIRKCRLGVTESLASSVLRSWKHHENIRHLSTKQQVRGYITKSSKTFLSCLCFHVGSMWKYEGDHCLCLTPCGSIDPLDCSRVKHDFTGAVGKNGLCEILFWPHPPSPPKHGIKRRLCKTHLAGSGTRNLTQQSLTYEILRALDVGRCSIENSDMEEFTQSILILHVSYARLQWEGHMRSSWVSQESLSAEINSGPAHKCAWNWFCDHHTHHKSGSRSVKHPKTL